MKKGLFVLFALLLCGMAIQAQDPTANGFTVVYGGLSYDAAADRTTFTYTVSGTNTPPDLSHFDIEIPDCETALAVVAYSPTEAVSFGEDPTTGVDGIKWDLPLGGDASRTYSITFNGSITEGTVIVAVKGGNGFEAISLPGPSCNETAVELIKSVSVDGGVTWSNADFTPGASADIGVPVSFLLEVTNVGDAPLTNITLSDPMFDTSACTIPATLDPDTTFECELGTVNAVAGQQTNSATVTAVSGTETISDTDSAFYFGGDLPSIDVEKYVSVAEGGIWYDADEAGGAEASESGQVSFRFVVVNNGTVELTNVVLSDDKLDTSSCAIPTTLAPEAIAECVVGPVDTEDGNHVNTAVVTAQANGATVTDTDLANYTTEDDSDIDVTIIIEGPIEAINGNIIIIYGIEIQLDPNDPLLLVIHVGDIVRVEGDLLEEGDTLVIIVVVIVVVDVEIIVVDGGIWRDEGNCSNPPPPWAPAWGWRRKCQVVYISRGSRGMGMGK